MQQISDFNILSVKQAKQLLNVQDERTARKYLNDIKKHYQVPKVLFCHFKSYFKTT